MFKISRPLSETTLLLLTTLLILGGHNLGYFHNTLQVYQSQDDAIFKLALLSILHGGLIFITLAMLGFGRLLKALLAVVLVVSAATAYFIDTYNIIIDVDMIDNGIQTDAAEIQDLLSTKQGLYILLLGLLPAWLVVIVPLKPHTWPQRLGWRLASILLAIGLMTGSLLGAGDFYASYLREHANLRYYSNPLSPLFGIITYIDQEIIGETQQPFQIIATDAKRSHSPTDKPKLTILVVGETVRADNFGLNGYHRNTTPLLAKENPISYTNVMSCGTSTAHSLPCMFSILGRKDFTKQQANNMENALDIVHKAGVQVVWIDNNSDAKGVTDRLTYIDAKSPNNNLVCTPECRDIGMLGLAEQWLQPLPEEDDKLVVLHQMGSHGPAYYKRYPKQFEKYTPTCLSNQLDTCSQEQIINTYDNTVLYTDYFLAETIAWLKAKQEDYHVSMLYISDHGESLGEGGLYLHGYPYLFAPKEQIHVPMVFWANKNNPEYNLNRLVKRREQALSHDNLFHTILGWLTIDSQVYQADQDFLAP
ncbi:MAG: phosphoethanolamine--lipid A transferase [Gammaproteobacteria bacterium]|nr:phosphoethanolamine--lipid A transferase [Gammaproteobacteria bacterium]